jgi:hypothetical protein
MCINEFKKWGCTCKSVQVMWLRSCRSTGFLILYVHLVGVFGRKTSPSQILCPNRTTISQENRHLCSERVSNSRSRCSVCRRQYTRYSAQPHTASRVFMQASTSGSAQYISLQSARTPCNTCRYGIHLHRHTAV